MIGTPERVTPPDTSFGPVITAIFVVLELASISSNLILYCWPVSSLEIVSKHWPYKTFLEVKVSHSHPLLPVATRNSRGLYSGPVNIRHHGCP